MLHRSISYSLILGLSAVALAVLLFAVGSATDAGAQTAPGLGTASSYAVLGGQTVTNTGPTTISGDVGVSPGTAVTGFPPGIVTGVIHSADAQALQAQAALGTAYDALAAAPCAADLTGQDLGGMTLTEGVYCFSSPAQLTGALTLNAQGNADAVFIFKTATALTTASGSSVLVTNGGTGCNVFWKVDTSATIGPGTVFVGNILALTSIALKTGASLAGRALARNGAVTLDNNHIGFSGCATASPTASATASATATPTAAATLTPTATPVGQTPTPTATPVGQTPAPTPTATPVGQTPTPTPTATPVGQTPTPHITPPYFPRTGGPSSLGDQVPWTLLLAGLVAGSVGASALVLGARARRRDAQQSGR